MMHISDDAPPEIIAATLDNVERYEEQYNNAPKVPVHTHSDDDFMVSQYEAKNYDSFQLLIRQLMHPSLNQGGFSAYP